MTSATFASFAFISMPSGPEWIVVGIIALLIFGRRLPEVMRGLGSGVREFREGVSGDSKESDQQQVSHQSPPTPAADQSSAPATNSQTS